MRVSEDIKDLQVRARTPTHQPGVGSARVTQGEQAPRGGMGTQFRWLLVGNLVYAVGQWLQLMILARMGGAPAVGAYTLALALAAPVMAFAALQLGPLQASDTAGAYAFREYRRLRVGTTIAAVFAISGIGWIMGLGREAWSVLVPVIAMRAADALADIYYTAWLRRERTGMIAFGMVLNALSSLFFMGAASMLGRGVSGAAVGAALGALLALAVVHARTFADATLRSGIAREPSRVAWQRVWRLAAQASPLGIIVLLVSLQQNVPRYFVQHHGGEAALGSFAAASQLTGAGVLVAAVLGAAATPRLGSLYFAGDRSSFRALMRWLMLAGLGLGVAGVSLAALAGRDLLVVLYRPEFGESARLLVVLSVAAGIGFMAALLGYALTAVRAIAVQPVVHVAALVVLLLGCAAVVPRYGAIGAAWALAAASLVQAVGSGIALHRWIGTAGASRHPGGEASKAAWTTRDPTA